MRQPSNDVIPLSNTTRVEPGLGARALWMLSVSVMVGVVVVAGLATAAVAVRAAS